MKIFIVVYKLLIFTRFNNFNPKMLIQAFRESTGTVLLSDSNVVDPVAAAEQVAFVKACARFGLGLYLYHEE